MGGLAIFCFSVFPPLPQMILILKLFLSFLKEIFNFRIINVNVLSICCIFLLPLCFFLLICAIPHLICKCLSLSYLRLSFLYLCHVCLCQLCLCPSIAICHTSHFDYVVLFHLFASLSPPPTSLNSLMSITSICRSAIFHICCIPSSHHTCSLPVTLPCSHSPD